MTIHRSIFEWATLHSGDPKTHDTRGRTILTFLQDEGLDKNHRVLEIGCGALSLGKPLIEWLAPAKYTALEPAGWTVEAALATHQHLEAQVPTFLWRSDFSAEELGVSFDFVVAADVFSHIAHAQLDPLLANTRAVVQEGAKFLLSYRRDQMNSWREDYLPDRVSTFRIETLTVAATRNGWAARPMYEYQGKMMEVCPNETLDWMRLTAIKPLDQAERDLAEATREHVAVTTEANDLRLSEEEVQDAERSGLRSAELDRIAALERADA